MENLTQEVATRYARCAGFKGDAGLDLVNRDPHYWLPRLWDRLEESAMFSLDTDKVVKYIQKGKKFTDFITIRGDSLCDALCKAIEALEKPNDNKG